MGQESDISLDERPDLLQPFVLEVPGLRGRLIRLGPLADTILSRHDYPDAVAGYLAEMLALASLLSSMLKFDGVFTLQTKSKGPVSLMVVDQTSEGVLRGYAEFDREAVEGLSPAGGARPSVGDLMGQGSLAYTVDRGSDADRYQGIVELKGESLSDCFQHYFRQSEQLKTAVKLSSSRIEGSWRAAGLLLQQMPETDEAGATPASGEEDDWRRAVVLMASCTDAELLDPGLSAGDLLYRLFHNERVRVFEPRPLLEGCRCSQERIERVLGSIPRDEIAEMKVDGRVTVTCQFCNREYSFHDSDLDRIYRA